MIGRAGRSLVWTFWSSAAMALRKSSISFMDFFVKRGQSSRSFSTSVASFCAARCHSPNSLAVPSPPITGSLLFSRW